MGRLGRIEDSILTLQNQIQGLAAYNAPQIVVGWIAWFDDYIAPSASFPFLCLADADKVLSSAKWPLLVPHYRQKALTYMPGTVSAQSDFAVSSYAISGGVVTLTFTDTTAEKKMISALAEDNLVRGSFRDWRTVTIPAIGAITAGTYNIVNLSAANRTVSFFYSSANVALTTINVMVRFYGHRLSSLIDPDNTQARHFTMNGRSLVSITNLRQSRRYERREPLKAVFCEPPFRVAA